MKVTSAILTTMSGKLGGAVASKSRGGIKYFRALVFPSQPRTTEQTRVRSILSALASAWTGTLSDSQRAAWSALATDQESGIDAYCRANAPRVQGGVAAVNDAPSSINLAATPFVSVVADASAHTLTLDTAVATGLKCNVYVSAPQSASRGARQFPLSYMGTIAAAGAALTLTSTQPPYNMVAGDVIYVRLVQFDATDAKVAQEQIFRVVVVA
jgi:hypothetical protein